MKFGLLFFLVVSLSIVQAQDHSELLEGPFNTPQEVTETCLTCHDEAGSDILQTNHWQWLNEEFQNISGDTLRMGKRNFINNFCIAVPSNYGRCTSCHIGYGWDSKDFDFSDASNIDCLICHDQTGTYRKIPTGAGAPFENVDLVLSAQSVGNPTKENCGICHFDGGGGTGVKHGDLDETLYNASPELDVHMGGLGFECIECHKTEKHQISGASHGSMAAGTNHINCADCHTEAPHKKSNLNDHSKSIACETCHIPEFAREYPTKIWWDWSKAGQDIESVPDEFGMDTYNKKKGEFRWGKNLVPTYAWYNGKAEYYRFGDKIDSVNVVRLNKLQGALSDSSAKIAPFKVMKGKQIYDDVNNYLIVPHLFGMEGYWKTFDWNKASELGMKEIGLDYSGSYGFIETEMYWPINHMVATAKDALKCMDCHGKKGIMDWDELGYEGDP
ncbi:tetrathionate reductase family octaheme c-type cytochrome, partial [Bacteroidota bacterium]